MELVRRIEIEQPFDLAISLTIRQAFRWRPVGEGWYSGVLKRHLVHLRQTPDGLEHRVGGPDGEIAAGDQDDELRRYFRLDTDDIESIYVDLPGRDCRIGPSLKRYRGVSPASGAIGRPWCRTSARCGPASQASLKTWRRWRRNTAIWQSWSLKPAVPFRNQRYWLRSKILLQMTAVARRRVPQIPQAG